ncbi:MULTISPECIES: S1 family peptidase [Mycobacteroides]|uniref:S1 family peptidase n=1 Tax=Mycobacteroides TaxID=670516 RepID=UPI0005E13698|nr:MULTISPECIES: S1 family peptidase [Mycobacteroides]CPS15013.1 trypsin domain-containing protein [Mycobacteroides abscessus]CPS52323.1 trypsin domain-containing protein [Mycobacteroides abscessus]CPY77809.1 trypsin domain-containing protein [Mycobacteroides abscessus]CPY80207.1 trypsin domain-containing protein [Mycobacteroides abscessus]SLJ39935.1 trypsin domain-containing protein [Mycobacteroides abscessus subsp. abscessus]
MRSASSRRGRRCVARAAGWAVALVLATATSWVAEPTANAEPAPGSDAWISIAGVRGSRPPVAFTAAAYPRPGVSLVQQFDPTEVSECTISWPIVSTRSDIGYLTAGHCDRKEGAPLWMYTDAEGAGRLNLSPLQNAERGVDDAGRRYDAALFFLSPAQQEAAYGTVINDGIRLRGVMSVPSAKALPAGTPVCMNGSRSGLTCGPLIAAGDDQLEWGGAAVQGDSGAPVFVVNSSGDAQAIGMLHGGPSDTDNFATYLAPVLERLKVRLIVDDKKGIS